MTATVKATTFRFWTLANVFTFARFAFAPVCAVLFVQQTWWGVWVAGWLGGLAMFTDFCDGYFARRQKQVSDLGKIFDPLADAVFFIMVWTALGIAGAYPVWFALPFIGREVVQHVYLRPSAMALGVVVGANVWGKLKTVVQTLVLIAICWVEFGIDYFPEYTRLGRYINLGLISLTALVSVASIIPYFGALRRAQRA